MSKIIFQISLAVSRSFFQFLRILSIHSIFSRSFFHLDINLSSTRCLCKIKFRFRRKKKKNILMIRLMTGFDFRSTRKSPDLCLLAFYVVFSCLPNTRCLRVLFPSFFPSRASRNTRKKQVSDCFLWCFGSWLESQNSLQMEKETFICLFDSRHPTKCNKIDNFPDSFFDACVSFPNEEEKSENSRKRQNEHRATNTGRSTPTHYPSYPIVGKSKSVWSEKLKAFVGCCRSSDVSLYFINFLSWNEKMCGVSETSLRCLAAWSAFSFHKNGEIFIISHLFLSAQKKETTKLYHFNHHREMIFI